MISGKNLHWKSDGYTRTKPNRTVIFYNDLKQICTWSDSFSRLRNWNRQRLQCLQWKTVTGKIRNFHSHLSMCRIWLDAYQYRYHLHYHGVHTQARKYTLLKDLKSYRLFSNQLSNTLFPTRILNHELHKATIVSS